MMNARTYAFGNSRLTLCFGDITTSGAEVLVSSDDGMLTMSGGVSAAIRRAAGEAVKIDAAKHIPVPLGDVVVTFAGALKAHYVFHAITIPARGETIAPREIIRRTTSRCIALLDEMNLSSIAFPAIGTGLAGFSLEDAAVEMSNTLATEFRARTRPIHATIYLFDRFGQKRPIDYVRFFELFAAHSGEFVKVAPPRKEQPAPVVPATAQVRAQADERQLASAHLAALSRERDTLEAQLVDWAGGLTSEQMAKVQERLSELHEERLRLLRAMQPATSTGVVVFISYAHVEEDDALRMKLVKHLGPLHDQGLVTTWHDRMITPGANWDEVIDDKIDAADIVLPLVSSDFMASRYCTQTEMSRALKRHAAGKCRVVPVILRPVMWQHSPLGKLQALPKDAKPVKKWDDIDDALLNVAEGVKAAIQDFLDQKSRSRPAAPVQG
jgi:O-acetyl-ADP-ribose deacetylase (regulator of RNase III)